MQEFKKKIQTVAIKNGEIFFGPSIEEGLKQKTRQNVVVLDWGSRSNAALGNFGVKV